MRVSIDAEQIESMLGHLARLSHLRDQEDGNLLESLRPAWLGMAAWEILLEDLKAQRYRQRGHAVRLRLVQG